MLGRAAEGGKAARGRRRTADNLRYAAQDSRGLRYFVWDTNGMNLLAERDEYGAALAEYSHGFASVDGSESVMAAKQTVGGVDYYQYPHYDIAGNVVKLTDLAGEVTHAYEYNAWGEPISATEGPAPNRLGYNANWIRLADSGGEQYLSPTRVYHARMGRFLGRDMLRARSGGYAYCRSSPVSKADASGMFEDEVVVKVDEISPIEPTPRPKPEATISDVPLGVYGYTRPSPEPKERKPREVKIPGGIAGAIIKKGVNLFVSWAKEGDAFNGWEEQQARWKEELDQGQPPQPQAARLDTMSGEKMLTQATLYLAGTLPDMAEWQWKLWGKKVKKGLKALLAAVTFGPRLLTHALRERKKSGARSADETSESEPSIDVVRGTDPFYARGFLPTPFGAILGPFEVGIEPELHAKGCGILVVPAVGGVGLAAFDYGVNQKLNWYAAVGRTFAMERTLRQPEMWGAAGGVDLRLSSEQEDIKEEERLKIDISGFGNIETEEAQARASVGIRRRRIVGGGARRSQEEIGLDFEAAAKRILDEEEDKLHTSHEFALKLGYSSRGNVEWGFGIKASYDPSREEEEEGQKAAFLIGLSLWLKR